MPDRMLIRPEPHRQWLVLAIILLACVAVLGIFRLQGLLLIIPILVVAAFVMTRRPDTRETTALRSSILLSADDIRDVVAEFERFADSPDTTAIADRTLARPALLDLDCTDPDIAAFHHAYATARRFLGRLDARLANESLEVPQLESLLQVTDMRALELKETWLAARQAAQRLGPDY
ncbi:MAG: hypothetical protein Q4G50_05845 [Corynebacterium sp.]|uniref:hypothetical protein n=1 Tax=Corynebacterium sp. TaxID=1720 RepID=UPI0026DEE2B2|nr:hypothetical protein [Corynebacterium sp.]MDO5669508.1 hypothetical protein [Corynebacterium sp.]